MPVNARPELHIMIVDDQRAMRLLVRSSLRQMGFHDIVECADGEEALSEFTLRPAHLIISDLNMPKLDGLGLLRAIRKMPGYEATPFILLTSRGEVETVKTAIGLGVNNYLVKPFNLGNLRRKLEAVVGPWE